MASFLNSLDEPVRTKALELLDRELIAWFTTVGDDGAPRAVPVWFLWHDGQISILTEPETVKVANVRRGSPVLIHLNSGPLGSDVVVLRGRAVIAPESTAEWLQRYHEPYGTKYAAALEEYGEPLDSLAPKFSTIIDFTPEHVLAW